MDKIIHLKASVMRGLTLNCPFQRWIGIYLRARIESRTSARNDVVGSKTSVRMQSTPHTCRYQYKKSERQEAFVIKEKSRVERRRRAAKRWRREKVKRKKVERRESNGKSGNE